MTEPIVKGRNLVKRFGSVVGLNHADFDLYPGEVLAVIGDNGAGKSTLIKCFAGAHTPDEGEMWLQGEQVEFRSTHEARERGVETVFQTLAVAPARLMMWHLLCNQHARVGRGWLRSRLHDRSRPD